MFNLFQTECNTDRGSWYLYLSERTFKTAWNKKKQRQNYYNRTLKQIKPGMQTDMETLVSPPPPLWI